MVIPTANPALRLLHRYVDLIEADDAVDDDALARLPFAPAAWTAGIFCGTLSYATQPVTMAPEENQSRSRLRRKSA
jgi:hypothetical protein